MERECTLPFKCLMIIVSFFPLLDTTLTIKIDNAKKDNHTIKNLTKVYDQRTSSSNFRMHGLHPMFNNGPDQLKTLYTNLGSSNNQIQLKYINPKYITGTGLIIRASDLGLAPEPLQQTNGLSDFLNDYSSLNQEQNQYLMRPIKDQLYQSRPELFQQNALKKVKRQRKKRKKRPIFKFNEQDSMEFNMKHNSMEFNKPSSMEFNRHNSMDFPTSGMSFKKKPRKSFEKSYDELVHSAKKLADTIENISTDDDDNMNGDLKDLSSANIDSDIKDLSSAKKMSSEIDKFNFDDIKLDPKDEDELENLSTFGQKKNMNTDALHEFDSVEENTKNAYSSLGDDQPEKFSDLFNQNFGDLFNDENGDKYGDDKLYDKIIGKINGDKKKKEKYSTFDDFSNDDKKTDKKKKKKKPAAADDDNQQQFTKDENTSDELMQNNKENNQENQDQTENNTNNSGHVETGEYDYSGYAKDPNEQYDDPQSTTELSTENEEKPENGTPDKYEKDTKQNDKYQSEQPTSQPIENNDNNNYKSETGDYKEQSPPQSTGEEQKNTESEGRSFRNSLRFRNTIQPFTRLTIGNAKNPMTKLSGLKDKLITNNKKNTFTNVNSNFNQFNQFDSTFTGRKGKKVVRVRSKRIQ